MLYSPCLELNSVLQRSRSSRTDILLHHGASLGTGMDLSRPWQGPPQPRYTHVILDEVHERSVDADLLSLVLKIALQQTPLKLVVACVT